MVICNCMDHMFTKPVLWLNMCITWEKNVYKSEYNLLQVSTCCQIYYRHKHNIHFPLSIHYDLRFFVMLTFHYGMSHNFNTVHLYFHNIYVQTYTKIEWNSVYSSRLVHTNILLFLLHTFTLCLFLIPSLRCSRSNPGPPVW